MILTARKALFYIFVATYCLLCPVLILYSLGYILNPINKEISRTGLIYLETTPPGADVYLENSRYQFKTPTSVNELLPGQYQVTLKLNGYRPWSHQVSITEGMAVPFKNIILIPKQMNPTPLFPDFNYQALSILPGTNYLALKKDSRLKDFYLFDWKKENLSSLSNNNTLYGDFSIFALYYQEKGQEVIIYGGSLWAKKFYLINFENNEPRIIDITKLFPGGKPAQLIWNAEEENNCFAVYEDHVDCLDLKKMALYPKIIEGVKGFGVSGKWLYLLENDNQISKMTMDGKPRTVIFKESYPDKDVLSKSRFYHVRVLINDILLFVGTNGDLLTMGAPQDVACEKAAGFEFYKQDKKLLYWTKDAVWITDLNKDTAKDASLSSKTFTQKVYEEGSSISQCFWAYNGTHIIFNDQNKIFILELSSDGKHHVEHIADVKNDSAMFYSDQTGYLFCLNKAGNLMKLEIVAEENVPLPPPMENEKDSNSDHEL